MISYRGVLFPNLKSATRLSHTLRKQSKMKHLFLVFLLQSITLPVVRPLLGKDPDAGRDWGQKEKGMTEDEMAGWHHRLDGHEFE